MSKVIQRKNIKIKSLSDLKLAKEIYNYEVRLYEQSLTNGVKNFKGIVMTSVRNTVVLYGQKVLISSLYRLLKA